jgi:hypothetical protein
MTPSSTSGAFTGARGHAAPHAPADSVGSPPVQPWETLYRYWCSKCVDGHPPAFKNVDPVIDIPRLAANLVLIDVRPDGSERIAC